VTLKSKFQAHQRLAKLTAAKRQTIRNLKARFCRLDKNVI
jgi:hypothetical protein